MKTRYGEATTEQVLRCLTSADQHVGVGAGMRRRGAAAAMARTTTTLVDATSGHGDCYFKVVEPSRCGASKPRQMRTQVTMSVPQCVVERYRTYFVFKDN